TSQVYISSADKVTHERIQPTILHREELGRGAGCDADARYEKSYPASPGVAKWTPVGRHRWRKDSSLQTPAWGCGWFQRHPGGLDHQRLKDLGIVFLRAHADQLLQRDS